ERSIFSIARGDRASAEPIPEPDPTGLRIYLIGSTWNIRGRLPRFNIFAPLALRLQLEAPDEGASLRERQILTYASCDRFSTEPVPQSGPACVRVCTTRRTWNIVGLSTCLRKLPPFCK